MALKLLLMRLTYNVIIYATFLPFLQYITQLYGSVYNLAQIQRQTTPTYHFLLYRDTKLLYVLYIKYRYSLFTTERTLTSKHGADTLDVGDSQ